MYEYGILYVGSQSFSVGVVLIVGAFVAGRRSAQAAVKGPPPARDAVETDQV